MPVRVAREPNTKVSYIPRIAIGSSSLQQVKYKLGKLSPHTPYSLSLWSDDKPQLSRTEMMITDPKAKEEMRAQGQR